MRIAGRARPVMWSSVGKLWVGRGQRVLCCPSPIHSLSTRSWRPYRQDVHMKGCVSSVLPLWTVLSGFLIVAKGKGERDSIFVLLPTF